ncbi:MAG: hypothetical protein R8L58_07335 [Mariprofundaceae bacterium]
MAGWVVTYKESTGMDRFEKGQSFYDGERYNTGDSIYTGRQLIAVDQGSRAYWKGTPEQWCKGLKAQFRKIRAQMGPLYAEHPEYRPVPISQKKVTRKKIGTKSIAGFTATGYMFFVDGIQSGEVWVSSDPGLSELIDLQHSMENIKCIEGVGDHSDLEDSALYKKTVQGRFILEEPQRQVLSVEKKKIPSERFEAPAGYKPFSDYQQFYEYISKHSESSSRSERSTAMPAFDMPSQQAPSSMQGEPPAHSNDEMDSGDMSSDEDQVPNMDDIKQGAGELFKGLGGLFGD